MQAYPLIIYINPSDLLKSATSNFEEVRDNLNETDALLAHFSFGDIYTYSIDSLDSLRPEEITSLTKEYQVSATETVTVKLTISIRKVEIIESLLSLCAVVLLSLVLLISIYLFNRDMYTMILNPLERMINKLKKVAKDPISAFKSQNESRALQKTSKNSMNETILIENAIYKISELLVLGFGQAGSKIISQYVFETKKDINEIAAGEMIEAIFGFCDIRNFTDATEVLLEQVMVFVNSIAEIVHTSVDEFK